MSVHSKSVKPIVELINISKEFPGVLALDNVSLSLYPGEVHALMGENGSGKSTLVKVLSGALPPTRGTIKIDGKEMVMDSPSTALDQGIVSITQELTLAPTLSVAENILLGRLPRKGLVIDWPHAYKKAEKILRDMDVQVDVRLPVRELSIELQQEIEIARAISTKSRVLILDEATSSLSMHATQKLLEKIEQLRTQGVAIIFISHRMAEIYACSQRATILRDGKFIDVVSVADTPESEMIRKMVGRPITDLFPKKTATIGEPLLEVSNLSTLDGNVQGVSFNLRRGEVLGIAGLVGCGKTELGLALFGAISSTYIDFKLEGKSLKINSPMDAINAEFAFVPEDRKTSAILKTRSVSQNLSVTWLDTLKRGFVINVKKELSMSETVRDRFGIKTPSLHTLITSLSGGNQQKVILSRWFAKNPKVVILTEPTRGVDVGAKREIYGFIEELVSQGAAVIMISSELPEILGMSDRVLVMYQGRVQKEFDISDATEEAIAYYAFGGGGLEVNYG